MLGRPRTLSTMGTVACAAIVTACSAIEPSLGPSQDDDAGATLVTGDDDGGATGDDGGGGGDSGGLALVSFKDQIRPLMNRSNDDPTGHGCAYCHYPGQGTMEGLMMTGLDLSTLGGLRKGGSTTGTGIIDVADPLQSGIVEKLQGHYFEGARMPKSGPPYWSDDEIQLVITWISQGAAGADSD
jgi:hypothetical protein